MGLTLIARLGLHGLAWEAHQQQQAGAGDGEKCWAIDRNHHIFDARSFLEVSDNRAVILLSFSEDLFGRGRVAVELPVLFQIVFLNNVCDAGWCICEER
ncbi:MAG: hypothetical protein ABI064_00345 [Acidobacteriaceae bacterium]